MKVALIGAGGTRAPLFVQAMARRAAALGPVELTLHDVDPERLRILGGLAAACARAHGDALRVNLVDRLDAAVDGARYVITSIRAGGDHGRVLDERIALAHGVIGQETVGAGGFAMAARSAAALLDIARVVERRGDGAWTLHFTNPAGLVTQVLTDAGHERQIGVCDSPGDLVRRIAAHLGVPPSALVTHVVGLNHLSWVVRVEEASGEDALPRLLADRDFRAAVAAPFSRERLAAMGALPGEYLYYYEHAAAALARQLAAPCTRAEAIESSNRLLLEDLAKLDPSGHFDATLPAALERYDRYCAERDASYRRQIGRDDESGHADPSMGYAGIALDLLSGLERRRETTAPAGGAVGLRAVLSTRNRGALPFLDADDVIETTAELDRDGPRPLPAPALSRALQTRITEVKGYERLASRAIRTGDRALAARALAAHPLVADPVVADTLVRSYVEAHSGDLLGLS